MHNRTAFHVLVGRGGQLWNSAASVDGGDRVGPVPPGSQLQRTTSRVVALGALLLNSVVVDGRGGLRSSRKFEWRSLLRVPGAALQETSGSGSLSWRIGCRRGSS